jgi:hypothetical protein
MRILVLLLVEGECARLVQESNGKPVVRINFIIIGIYSLPRVLSAGWQGVALSKTAKGNQVMELGSYSCFFYEKKDGHIIIL